MVLIVIKVFFKQPLHHTTLHHTRDTLHHITLHHTHDTLHHITLHHTHDTLHHTLRGPSVEQVTIE